MSRPDDDPPLYVPAEFEAEHLADARRTVILSLMRRDCPPSFASPARETRGRPAVVLFAHLVAVAMTLVFTIVTGTWLAGIVVLVAVASSLLVTSSVTRRLGGNQAVRRRRRPD